MTLRIIPVVIAYLLLAAHFLRDGHIALVLTCLVVPCLLLIKRHWALVVVRLLVVLGAFVWIQTTIVLVQHRWETGAPWLRMLVILAGVTVFTLLGAFWLGSEKVRQHYL